MNINHLREWEAKVNRGKQILSEIASVGQQIELLEGDGKIEVNLHVGPTSHSKHFLSVFSGEGVRSDVVVALVRILKDCRIRLEWEFKEL